MDNGVDVDVCQSRLAEKAVGASAQVGIDSLRLRMGLEGRQQAGIFGGGRIHVVRQEVRFKARDPTSRADKRDQLAHDQFRFRHGDEDKARMGAVK